MTTVEAIKIIMAKQCQCGKAKPNGETFCLDCIEKLPYGIRAGFWLKPWVEFNGMTFQKAYAMALEVLALKGEQVA